MPNSTLPIEPASAMAQSPMRTTTDKSMAAICRVVKLIPSTTVVAFQTLNPSFSNSGQCVTANRYLTASLIIFCSVTCAFFSITDSVVYKGKLYFGVATLSGLYVFNFDESDCYDDRTWLKERTRRIYRLNITDGVHVGLTISMFLALAFSDANVQGCFFSSASENQKQLLKNLPMGFGALASIVFMLVPYARKGIGYTYDSRELKPDSSSEMEPLQGRDARRRRNSTVHEDANSV